MVEAGANEIPEAEILDALDIAHDAIKKLCAAQRELAEKAGKEKLVSRGRRRSTRACSTQIRASARRRSSTRPRRSTTSSSARTRRRPSRRPSSSSTRATRTAEDYAEQRGRAQLAFDELEKATIRERIAVHKKRPDGRGEREIRPITIEVGLAAAHARLRALHARPDAGAQRRRPRHAEGGDAARHPRARDAEVLLPPLQLPALLAWARPASCAAPSAVTSATARSPSARWSRWSRRTEEFPYTIRVVSDILESNGSSSMASVCGSSLSLMDAGVPIKAPVAGIAMGLIKEGDDYIVLTDIAGVEDHLGDMDFKVAGTAEGITALQMDIKITGVTFDILRDALTQARDARLDILGKMDEVIDGPRTELSPHAPRIISSRSTRRQDRPAHRQGRRDDPRPAGRVRVADRRQRRGPGPRLLLQRRAGRGARRAHPLDDQGGRGRRRVHRQGRQDDDLRRLRRARQGHRRPAAHLQHRRRASGVDTVEEVLNKGDEIQVRVVEVDRERGRIGLRLADDPDDRGQVRRGARARWRSAATAAAAATAVTAATAARPRRRPRVARLGPPAPRRAGATRDRDGAASSRLSTAIDRRCRLGRADRHGVHGLRPIRRPWASGSAPAPSTEDEPRGRPVAPAGAHAVPRHGPLRVAGDRPALRRHGRRAQRGHRQGDHVGLRRACSTSTSSEAFDVMADMVWRPRIADGRPRQRAPDRPRGDRDVRGRPAGQGLRRPRRGGLRRPPARPRDHRPRATSWPATPADELRAFHAARYVPAQRRRGGGRLGRPRRARRARAARRRRARRRPRPRRRPAAARRPRGPACGSSPRRPSSTTSASARPGIARDDERRFALRVLDTILGGTSSSRLFQEVREKRGLAYSVYSFQSLVAGTGPGRPLPRHAAGQRRRARCASSASELERFVADAGHRRGAARARRRTSRAASCSRSSRPSARMNRLGSSRPGRAAAADRRRDRSSASTP